MYSETTSDLTSRSKDLEQLVSTMYQYRQGSSLGGQAKMEVKHLSKKKSSKSIDFDSEVVNRAVKTNNYMTIDERTLPHYGVGGMIEPQLEPSFAR